MKAAEFKDCAYEIAFGDGAINKGYSNQEVIDQLLKQSQELHNFHKFVKKKLKKENPCDQDQEDFEYLERLAKDLKEFWNNQ